MTRDEIMEMAEQAGLIGPSSRVGYSHEATERFYHLAVAAEREACAKVADDAKEYNRHISKEIADAIRARSQS